MTRQNNGVIKIKINNGATKNQKEKVKAKATSTKAYLLYLRNAARKE